MKKLLLLSLMFMTLSIASYSQNIQILWAPDFVYNENTGSLYVGDPQTQAFILVMYERLCVGECPDNITWAAQYRKPSSVEEAETLMTILANDKGCRGIYAQIIFEPIKP